MKTIKIINFVVMYPEAFWILYVYFGAMKGPGFIPSGWSPVNNNINEYVRICITELLLWALQCDMYMCNDNVSTIIQKIFTLEFL